MLGVKGSLKMMKHDLGFLNAESCFLLIDFLGDGGSLKNKIVWSYAKRFFAGWIGFQAASCGTTTARRHNDA